MIFRHLSPVFLKVIDEFLNGYTKVLAKDAAQGLLHVCIYLWQTGDLNASVNNSRFNYFVYTD